MHLQHIGWMSDSLQRHDRDKMNMVLHAMLVAIQSAIDISNHIIAEKKLRKPATYREAFEILQNDLDTIRKCDRTIKDMLLE